MNSGFITLVLLYYCTKISYSTLFTYIGIITFTIASLIFIRLYNHKKGKDTKHILYLFYPLHLMIIYGIHVLITYINL